MASRHRSSKAEGRDLESLIADFAREIQVLGDPQAVQEGNGKSPSGEAPTQRSHTSSSVVDNEPAPPKIEPSDRSDRERQTRSTPQPPVTQPTEKVSVHKIPMPDPDVAKDLKSAKTELKEEPPVEMPAQTELKEEPPVEMPAQTELEEEPPVEMPAQTGPVSAPVAPQSTKDLPLQAGQGQSQAGSSHKGPVRLRKTQAGSRMIVLGKDKSAWVRARIPLSVALAVTAAMVLGWLVATELSRLA